MLMNSPCFCMPGLFPFVSTTSFCLYSFVLPNVMQKDNRGTQMVTNESHSLVTKPTKGFIVYTQIASSIKRTEEVCRLLSYRSDCVMRSALDQFVS